MHRSARSAGLLTAALSVCVLALAGCSRNSGPHTTGRAPALPREWPQGRAAPVKITEQLLLAIPLQYQRSAIEPGGPLAPPAAPSGRGEVHFDFFLPGFSGYTLQNYRNDSDQSKVEVAYVHAGNPHEADPGAPGEYPRNMLERSLREVLDPSHFQDQYGLRCYRWRTVTDRISCYGPRDAAGEDIMLTALVPPYPADVAFPEVQARYFSKRYGGVRISWRTHVRNLPRWRAIDQQIWKFIDAWNLAQPSAAAAPRR
ncbi:MAG: hypothetical protein WAK94_02880 [Steroidobacteraceae bacterium]